MNDELVQLRQKLRSKAALDPRLRRIRNLIDSGKATFKDTSEYSQIYSEILGSLLSGSVLSLKDREAVCQAMLRESHEAMNDMLAQVQRSLDEKIRLHIQPQKPAFPAERVQQFAHSLSDPSVPDETIQRRAENGAANISASFHDDYTQENAKLRSKAGLKCYILRQTNGSCCKWCSAMAGKYVYGEEPQDVYRRHDNCTCTVTYINGRERQDVWSKRKWSAPVFASEPKAPVRFDSSNRPKGFSPKVLTNNEVAAASDEGDVLDRLKNSISGNSYLNTIKTFEESLSDMQNKTVSNLLKRAHESVNYEKSERKNSYITKDGKTVFLTNNANHSTVAHELFHKIDLDNNISESGLLDNCINSDYERIIKKVESTGQSLEDMLYSKYPEAFERKGRLKEEYRGISDIINGMTHGKINLGYHHDSKYWEKPFRIQKEVFAQYGRIIFKENPAVMKMMNEMFPDITARIDTIIIATSKFGR